MNHRQPEHWVELDRSGDVPVLNRKQAAELIHAANASGDPLLREFLPMLVDAYCRLHNLR